MLKKIVNELKHRVKYRSNYTPIQVLRRKWTYDKNIGYHEENYIYFTIDCLRIQNSYLIKNYIYFQKELNIDNLNSLLFERINFMNKIINYQRLSIVIPTLLAYPTSNSLLLFSIIFYLFHIKTNKEYKELIVAYNFLNSKIQNE